MPRMAFSFHHWKYGTPSFLAMSHFLLGFSRSRHIFMGPDEQTERIVLRGASFAGVGRLDSQLFLGRAASRLPTTAAATLWPACEPFCFASKRRCC